MCMDGHCVPVVRRESLKLRGMDPSEAYQEEGQVFEVALMRRLIWLYIVPLANQK